MFAYEFLGDKLGSAGAFTYDDGDGNNDQFILNKNYK